MTSRGGAIVVTKTGALKKQLLHDLLLAYVDPGQVLGWRDEYRFDAKRKWRFDVALTEVRVAIEFHGGEFTRGRHVRGRGFIKDCWKTCAALAQGWLIFPVTWQMLREDLPGVGDLIRQAIDARRGPLTGHGEHPLG